MRALGPGSGHNLLVSRVGTNLDLLGPRDLTVLANMDSAEKRLVREPCENASAHVRRKVDDALDSIWIGETKPVSRECLHFYWPLHEDEHALPRSSAQVRG